MDASIYNAYSLEEKKAFLVQFLETLENPTDDIANLIGFLQEGAEVTNETCDEIYTAIIAA